MTDSNDILDDQIDKIILELMANSMAVKGSSAVGKKAKIIARDKIKAFLTNEKLGASATPEEAKQPKDSKSLPYSWRGDEPSYVLERRPYEEHSVYQIWVKHDDIKVSSSQLSKMLADFVQSQVKVTDLADERPETTTEPLKSAQGLPKSEGNSHESV